MSKNIVKLPLNAPKITIVSADYNDITQFFSLTIIVSG